MAIFRSILAVFVGLILMGVTVALVESIGHGSYPIPPELNELSTRYAEARVAAVEGTATADDAAAARSAFRDAVSGYIETAPLGALLFVVAAWISGGFVGAAVAAFLTTQWRIAVAIVVGLFDVLGILAIVVAVPHPVWMTLLGIIGTMVASLLAGVLVERAPSSRRAATV